MAHWMFNCNEVSQKVWFHLQMCKYCARFRDQLLLIRKAIRTEEDPGEELRPSESSFSEPRERIKQTLRDQLIKKSD